MYFTPSHEWIVVSGNLGTIGVTDFAQKELGEVVYVDLPKVGQILQQNEAACVLESTKAAVDVYSPVSGKVVKVNENLKQSPSLINGQAQEEGWLFQLELSNAQELEQLLGSVQYESLSHP